MLSTATIKEYNHSRGWTDKSLICHAPFVNLNFEQNGNITACCYNRKEVLGRYPNQSILEAWHGQEANNLRELISQNLLEGGCKACGELLESGNYKGVKALTYDEFAVPKLFQKRKRAGLSIAPPKVLEFEISNTCNLECSMCNGYFSSTIRRNREGLPPLPMVYDKAFVEQVKELMPGLTDMKFLGGEPFLIDLYYDIWEAIPHINPNIRVHITTNGTVLNQRGKNILNKLRVGVVVSLDSIDAGNYAAIRKGGNLEKVMENVAYFKQLAKKNKTYLSIAACAMRDNWQHLPALLDYCNREGFKLHFNTVWTPEELSLQGMSKEGLKQVMTFLESQIPDTPHIWEIQKRRNVEAYKNLINTLRYWWSEKFRARHRQPQVPSITNNMLEALAAKMREGSLDMELLAALLMSDEAKGIQLPQVLLDELKGHRSGEMPLLTELKDALGSKAFNERFVALLDSLSDLVAVHPAELKSFSEKTSMILSRYNKDAQSEILANLFINAPILEQVKHVNRLKKEELIKLMEESFA